MLFWLLYCCGWCLGSFVGFVCGLFGCCCLASFGGLGWLVGTFVVLAVWVGLVVISLLFIMLDVWFLVCVGLFAVAW